MKKMILAGLAVLTLSECISMQDSFLRDKLKEQEKIVNYFQDGKGYTIDTPFEEVRFAYRVNDKNKKTCTLMTPKEILFNQDCNETVDLVEVKGKVFSREELTEKLKKFYDDLYSIYKDGLRVERVHKKWKSLK